MFNSENSSARSRSPNRPKSEVKTRYLELQRSIDHLKSKKSRLIEEKNSLRDIVKELKKDIDIYQNSLESYKSASLIFLPCGHQKTVNIKYKDMLDDTFKKALDKLTQDELKNEIFLRQLRSKIFYALESLSPETYRCAQQQRYTNERCGHISTAECHETKKYAKQLQYPACNIKVEVHFECGHSDYVECSSRLNSKCTRCI